VGRSAQDDFGTTTTRLHLRAVGALVVPQRGGGVAAGRAGLVDGLEDAGICEPGFLYRFHLPVLGTTKGVRVVPDFGRVSSSRLLAEADINRGSVTLQLTLGKDLLGGAVAAELIGASVMMYM
jgi:hypothetical protein